MCRSITYRYSICTHSWRPYVIPCANPIKNISTDIDSMHTCPAYKIRYERRVIKSGNGLCAACWEKQERREKFARERERILEGKMRKRVGKEGERRVERSVVGSESAFLGGKGVRKENGDVRIWEDTSEEPGVVLEERVGNLRRDDEESEKLLQETENKTWILEGNGGVRKKLDGNERKRIRNGWLG
ncbi:hypothetical protein BTUL_0138g00190 [Botrytis tulipae]|uniref:Uncharacterized protein n=1 Tax=Botrytis tulipae TaxID=87230 RepID=A0A4Z1EHR3_9HELO|nr:hypothetical protein BTUL_0138g00190 [Botrytis tulipae]